MNRHPVSTLVIIVTLLFAAYCIRSARAATWDYVEHYRPISLRQCPQGTTITISTSGSVNGPWRSFCYRGKRV